MMKNHLWAIRLKPQKVGDRLVFNPWTWQAAKKNIHDYYERGKAGRRNKHHVTSPIITDDLPF